ncbi:MAG: deacylase [Alphaproteobacteria bacterium]|nr:deacylase [Alphaproteobacteria bacterium]
MAKPTRIESGIDFDKDGKQIGWLGLPHSVTRSAYGRIMIPIACVRNGAGPTAFFMAGNHGDEYEGQIALVKLIRALEPGEIKGRVIVLPAANLPAALDSARVSPIDDGNLNRCFPGDPDGSVTQQIAYYIDTKLFPRADLFHDLHSGGSSLDYVPFASMHEGADEALNRKCRDALVAFAPENALVWKLGHDIRYSPAAAMRRGVASLGGEFGGTGSVNRPALAQVERGLRRLLVHLGIAEKPKAWAQAAMPRRLSVPGQDWFVYAPEPGLFEPATDLGENVRKGQLCGHVHFVDNPARAPVPCHFKEDGMVVCKRHFGRVERGDCVAHLAVDEKW